jgi:aspartyl-tRNA(Asn)/glutamyl-tRNA(Gln) amidotransferase subunit B
LPHAKRHRFMSQYGLSAYDAGVLTASRAMAAYYEEVVAAVGATHAKVAANWVMGDLAGALNREGRDISESPIGAQALAGLIRRILDNTISGKIAKEVFEAMWAGEGSADEIIEARGLRQITDSSAIERLVEEVIAAHPKSVEEYRAGKERALNALVGQVMKRSQGKANPQQVSELLKRKLAQ